MRADVKFGKARLNERFAALAAGDESSIVNFSGCVVVADEDSERSDITFGAVRVAGANDEALGRADLILCALRGQRLCGQARVAIPLTPALSARRGRIGGNVRRSTADRNAGIRRTIRAFENGGFGKDFDAGDLGDVRRIFGGAGIEPREQSLAESAVGAEAHAARVLNGAETFLDDETLFGNGEIDTTPDLFARKAIIIAFGIEAEKREAKTIFAAR